MGTNRKKRMQRRGHQGGKPHPELTKRIVIYGLLVFLLSVAMSSFFANLRHLPATPDLMLGAVLAIAVLDGRHVAAIVAVAGGIFVDALGGVGASLSPLLYLAVILTVGILSEKMLPRFLSWLILLLPSLVLRALFTLAGFLIYSKGGSLAGFFGGVLLPEAITTLLFCLPLYFVVILCVLPLKDHRKAAL